MEDYEQQMKDDFADPDEPIKSSKVTSPAALSNQQRMESRHSNAQIVMSQSNRNIMSRHSSKKSVTASAHHKAAKKLEPEKYAGEEDNIVCGRFPHMDTCACDIQCSIALREINLFEVYPGILMGPYQAGFKTKALIDLGVTHILNATCREYMKRRKYFKYLDVQIYDTINEDSKKHYRITSRFIDEGRKQGKILVHSVQGKSRAATFILAYLIGKEKIKLKDGISILGQYVPEVEPNEAFMQQLAEYDLEILSKY